MKTPLYDFVSGYIASGTVRMHMPGHKGKGRLGIEERDITEIAGADVLSEAEGIIGASERNASKLFGTARTVYSAEGSSLAIRAMLYLALQRYRQRRGGSGKRPYILAARNVHKVFIYACALLDLDVVWLPPDGSAEKGTLCSAHPTPESVRAAAKALRAAKAGSGAGEIPAAVYLTSPDYLGSVADIKGIRKAADEAFGPGEVPVLVDNAHGAYLHFLTPPLHPLDLGAYMSADSAHKTLPVLTGGAYLQLSPEAEREAGEAAKEAMSLFASTSPSYLILQSLDLCNACLSGGYRDRLSGTVRLIDEAKRKLGHAGIRVLPSEPLKLVVDSFSVRQGFGGGMLGEELRAAGIEPEFTDLRHVVFMLTPENTEEEIRFLVRVLKDIKRTAGAVADDRNGTKGRAGKADALIPAAEMRVEKAAAADEMLLMNTPERRMTIREAVLSPQETVSVRESAGRVCASASVTCPPAVPPVVSGEVITEEHVRIMLAYGIERIRVVKEPLSGEAKPR